MNEQSSRMDGGAMNSSSKKILSILAVALMVIAVFCAANTDGASSDDEKNTTLVLDATTPSDVSNYFTKGTASYYLEGSEGVLTLTDVEKTIDTTETLDSVIKTELALKIIVIGENTIKLLKTNDTGNVYGIYCKNTMEITSGDQSKACSINVEVKQTSGISSNGIYAETTSITNGVTVTAKACDGSFTNHICGLYSHGKLAVKDSSLFAFGGNNTVSTSCGIYVSAVSETNRDMEASNSHVVAQSGESSTYSNGMYVESGVTIIKGSEVEIEGKSGEKSSRGVYCWMNKFKMEDSALVIKGKNTAISSDQKISNFTNITKVVGVKADGTIHEFAADETISSDTLQIVSYVPRDVIYDTDGGSTVTSHKVDTYLEFNISSTVPTKEGYNFKGWIDENGDTYQAGAEYTMPGHSTTFTAVWEEVEKATVTVKSSSSEGGTVTGGGTYNIGATATVTATANSGYEFVQWSDGSTDATHTFTVTGDVTLTATFKEKSPGPTPVPSSDCADPVMFVIWFFVAFLFACVIGGAIYQGYNEGQQKK